MVRRGTPEGRIKAACLRYLAKRGVLAWNNPTGATRIAPNRWVHFGLVGSSDIIGILPGGRFLAIEVKAPQGRLAAEQEAFLDRIRELGGLALVARSWQEVDRALREGGYVDDGPLFDS